jgi:PhnB protein
MTEHIPEGWPALIPRIAVDSPEGLVSFLRDVFGTVGDFHSNRPSELRFGDSILMVGSTIDREPTTAFLYVYVYDTDATFQRALDRDAVPLEEPQDMPYGDRRAMIRDPWGNTWQIATHGGAFTRSAPPPNDGIPPDVEGRGFNFRCTVWN